jgi:hypothetical protein
LLVGAAFDVHALERSAGEVDGRVQRKRRELLALSLGDRLRLACRELLEAPHELVGVTAERKSESATAFHGANDSYAWSSGSL